MPVRLSLVCCLVALFTRVLGAAPQPASTKPPEKSNQQPASAQAAHPDESASAAPSAVTPKGALKLLAAALRDGDAERIRQVMYAANPSEAKMVTAMADMAKSMAALQKSAIKAFGREGAKEVVGDTNATDTESKARIDSADVKVQGDTATVTMEDGEEAPVVLKRVDGRWRLPMSELSRGADLGALEERLAGLAEQSKLVRELADEVAAGKYASPAQAHEAWQSRAMQASMRKAAAPNKPEPKKPPVPPASYRR